jgi:hypothetical protein
LPSGISDCYHPSEPLYSFAKLLYPTTPTQAQVRVTQKLNAWLTGHLGDILGALKRLRLRQSAVGEALRHPIGYVENNRARLDDHYPWHNGLAVGSGFVEEACKHII